MLPPAFSNTPESVEGREYEQLIQDGIIAVKNGDRAHARRLLDQAAMMNGADARVWIWLSATTDDLQERKAYLEHAVAVDPSDATAKRGLLMVIEKLEKARLEPEAASAPAAAESATPEEEQRKTYLCPNCGATINYASQDASVVCPYCGFTRKVGEQVVAESSEQDLDTHHPSAPSHRWADGQTHLACEQCGAVILLDPGQTADSCPYCGANRFNNSPTLLELADPQLIGLFKIDTQKAERSIKTWLGKGLFAPDDLAARHSGMHLHPAFYPFWIFEGTLEIPWFCDVDTGKGEKAAWESHTGSEFQMFQDVVIPGLKKISPADLAGIEPFVLTELAEFSPDLLESRMAITYDRPLADASLEARESVARVVKQSLPAKIEPHRRKRNFSIGAGKWSDLTYKLALLPIYVGNYPFQGQRYRLFVNGQTGKVHGKKPTDTLKVLMLSIGGLILLIVFITILYFFRRLLTG